ncbi:MAG: hypothetical protein SGILL_007319, partial [Bacillariaceae sp.]
MNIPCPLCGYNDSRQQQQQQPSLFLNGLTGEAASAASIGACWTCISAIADATEDTHYHHGHDQGQSAAHPSFSESFSAVDNFYDEFQDAAGQSSRQGGGSDRFNNGDSTTIHQRLCDFENVLSHYTINEDQVAEPLVTATTTTVYIGDYNDRGQRHGAHGELLWDNGDRYVGSFVNGKRTGSGTLFFRDGEFFDTIIETEESHAGSVYTGDWLEDKMHGRGQRTFADGCVYVGSYRHGQRSGGPDCKIKLSNGDIYVGNWDSNFFHGHGRYFFADGTALEGDFVHGKKQGKFKRQKGDGTLDILRYENDNVSGQGVRWNSARTKTWLLKTVADKNQAAPNHRRNLSDDSFQGKSHPDKRHQRCLSVPNLAQGSTDGSQELLAPSATSPSEYDFEPTVEPQVVTRTKKSSRIPIAQAVSIGYDCELGEAIRDTNPAFWSIGDFSNNVTGDSAGLQDPSS